MKIFITVGDVDTLLGADWADEAIKPKSVRMANVWLNSLSLRPFRDDVVPDDVKEAGAYAASVASLGKLYQQKNGSEILTGRTVKSDSVSVTKSFSETGITSTSTLPADLQLALALLKPWGVSTNTIRVVRG